MADVELIGVPFDGYGRPGNQAAASQALRSAGLAGAFPGHRVTDGGDLALPAPDPSRGEHTSLVNETALLAMVDRLGERVARVVEGGRFPVVHGGDCTTLLATIPALSDTGPVGLLFLDGHEDTMPLDVSEDGEAANTEIGLLLGLTGGLLRGPLSARRGVLGRQHLAVLGPRDEDWRRRFNVGSLRDLGVWFRDSRETAARPEECGREAVRHLGAAARRWWLHVDLDVLDPRVLPAQGVPGDPGTPGGLGWEALTAVLRAALGEGGCLGWSLAIYDPEQDPDRRDADRIVELVADVAPLISQQPPTR
ncbi:arginase family protein [Nocardioides sp. MAH-18]|uniref:Arginase family protein n=1 Tax=Nocardioides agri TaxID=2682843 RepID=A0A6L6XY66_9ACTN|nr:MULTISPECIES: arginase family protein [unclassified Nocardioides]MBA2952491.1 arginase family protein [Nocardioides sp. CGMCC 1.13656]MVQ51653.1 arginase family protein [Nocardioides sp. MAH-18]